MFCYVYVAVLCILQIVGNTKLEDIKSKALAVLPSDKHEKLKNCFKELDVQSYEDLSVAREDDYIKYGFSMCQAWKLVTLSSPGTAWNTYFSVQHYAVGYKYL